MKKIITTILFAAIILMSASAATVKNDYFTLTTPDDSWFLTNDDALRPYGARVDVARMDARGATLELARIDYIEGAFDPLLYLTHQVLEKKDVFCRTATNFTDVYDSFLAHRPTQSVQFKKTSNNYTYDCEAAAFNVGYGTVLVIMAHRNGIPSLIGRVLDALIFNVDTTPVTTAAQCVNAASKVVSRHHLPIGPERTEHVAIERSGDDMPALMVGVVAGDLGAAGRDDLEQLAHIPIRFSSRTYRAHRQTLFAGHHPTARHRRR